MAEMTPARKRLAILFIAVGAGLIVERTLASGGDADADVVVSSAKAAPQEDAASATPRRVTSPPAASEVQPVLRLEALAQRRRAVVKPDGKAPPIFAVQSWQPPPPPQAPVPAVEPGPPPFPYPYLGGLTDDAGRTAFFSRGDRVLAVRSGANIDGQYRVDHLDETSMTLTYLPLQKTLDVALGGRP